MVKRDVSFHARLLCGAAVVAIAAGGTAQAQDRAHIHIEPQLLVSALNEFGVKTGQPVISTPELTASKLSPGVKDADDPAVALAQLLSGTGLSYRCSGDTYLIVPSPESGPAPKRCVVAGAGGSDGAEAGTVEALIVTAQKREEDIQDVPIAISAFTQEDLTRSQVAGGPDLMTQVPNFTFTKTNFSGYSIQIRGIGTQAISATVDPAVAVAFNNTPFIRNRFFEQEFYDLERVEVLRGPQGTLYGRNATAGVVNIISAKPTFRYQAKLSGDVGNYNSTRLEGMINLPLVDDKVALRLAGAWTKRDGYDTNEITGNPIDGRDLWSTRVSLRMEPTDRFGLNLIWEHFNENDDRLRSGKQLCHTHRPTEIGGRLLSPDNVGPGALGEQQWWSQGCAPASLYTPESFQTPNGASLPYYLPLSQLGLPIDANFPPYLNQTQSRDLRVIESTVDPKYRAKSDLVELQMKGDISDNLTLASETSYSTDFIFSSEDYNRFNTTRGVFVDDPNVAGPRPGVLVDGAFCDPQIGCADRLVGLDLSTAKSRQFSQELRLSSDFEGPLNFSFGANFLRYDTEDKYYVFINTLTLWTTGGGRVMDDPRPWIPNVSDNHECLGNFLPGDWTKTQAVTGCIYVDPNPIESLNDLGHNYFLSRNPYKLISYAAFGEAYYNIADNLKLTAGLRWTVDKKQAPQIPSWLLAAGNVGYPVVEVVNQEWREPTGRVTLDWKPDLTFTDESLLYASYAHGYKAGGANPPPATIVVYSQAGSDTLIANSLAHPRTFDPEFINAFEVGTKNTLLDGKLTLNANAFYYDYTGYQISQIVDRAAINYNFDARIWGLEFEADWRPLENFRFGLKTGYENTRVADGSKAIDTMDRTGGDPNYVVSRPFPTIPSNCILPVWFVNYNETLGQTYFSGAPQLGACLFAYDLHVDPITGLPYVPNPTESAPAFSTIPDGYPGFNPASVPNNGEGIPTDLSGNDLPNAPHFTTTITTDYTLPLPHDWLMTLHGDFYYQSEAWTRIFNMPGYDKLKAYTNVNLAAIFSNEDAGWKVMAYIKNVMNRDSITGAFLNSDDTGLTTNVFLTEPRLYGLRVTKEWTGEGWWTGGNPNHRRGDPYPLTVELGGSVDRFDAPNAAFRPGFVDTFTSPGLPFPASAQSEDLDWGDGREVKITYGRPGQPWRISAGARRSETNGSSKHLASEKLSGGRLLSDEFLARYPYPFLEEADKYVEGPTNYVRAEAPHREETTLADFDIGRDFGLGSLGTSNLAFGLRYAQFKSTTSADMGGISDHQALPSEEVFKYASVPVTRYRAILNAEREFTGAGPAFDWTASRALLGDNDRGHLDFDLGLTGGILFGKQKADVQYATSTQYQTYSNVGHYAKYLPPFEAGPGGARHDNRSAIVYDLGASAGASYTIDRMKISGGYRIERFFNVLDGGVAEPRKEDRTLDGPYFKIAVGFGG